jgi:signal transduction histidine kinase
LRPEELEASALLEDTRERFVATAGAAGVELEVVASPTGRPALRFAADRLAVERILANLVSNALGVTPSGGHVWLDAQPVAGPVSGPGDGPAVALSVTDDGPGFPPGAASRAFVRFYRADPARSGGGRGLGLAIVQELAAAHGGTAHAENVAPHGARVSVVLPVVPRIQLA